MQFKMFVVQEFIQKVNHHRFLKFSKRKWKDKNFKQQFLFWIYCFLKCINTVEKGGGGGRLMQLQQRLNPQLLLLTNFFESSIGLLKGILTFNYEQYWILVWCFDFDLLTSIWPSKSQGRLDLLSQTCTTSKYKVQRMFPAYHA